MTPVTILDTTLRDGSYAVNFSFTIADTRAICAGLESAGIRYIEVGHGVGLHAREKGYGEAIHSDEEYMEAARQALTTAQYGMFCIPGIARLSDIDTAARHGMGFIRIGTNITQVKESKEFIAKAKKKGMFVCANYMKSYALSPKEFAQNVKLSQAYGADMVYIVDSAGGMFPEEVVQYVEAIRAVSDIQIGFHGHENLGMAVANSLAAIKAGVSYVDGSLQGLGRSAGNAATEILALALIKQGYPLPVDMQRLLDVGQRYIQPLLTTKGKPPLDMVAGFADFHSSYMHLIHKYSAKYQVNPIVLMIEISRRDKVNVDESVLDAVAQTLQTAEVHLGTYDFSKYIGREQDPRRD